MSKKCERSVNRCENSVIYSLFTTNMKRHIYSTLLNLFLIALICSLLACEKDDSLSQVSKIALRDVGNKLLLSSKDSTSLILPVTKVKEKEYVLAFENQLLFEPNTLVSIVKESFKKADLPSNYRVEVIQCADNEVAYSYEINNEEEKSIIPCAGRKLLLNCYTIQVKFISKESLFSMNHLSVLAIVVLVLSSVFILKKKKKSNIEDSSFSKIGTYKFYKDQNKLIKNAIEIKLSAKECELMSIFSANQNKVIKREILVKEIWEDNGVFVDRSLDTFVSKLRKKFKNDPTINIINVHGVGYKLEVN
jgi:hypothetical protein